MALARAVAINSWTPPRRSNRYLRCLCGAGRRAVGLCAVRGSAIGAARREAQRAVRVRVRSGSACGAGPHASRAGLCAARLRDSRRAEGPRAEVSEWIGVQVQVPLLLLCVPGLPSGLCSCILRRVVCSLNSARYIRKGCCAKIPVTVSALRP